jgi:hypothetical protein
MKDDDIGKDFTYPVYSDNLLTCYFGTVIQDIFCSLHIQYVNCFILVPVLKLDLPRIQILHFKM